MYFLLVSQRAEPYDEFLEIGPQEDSVFGFFGLKQKIFGKEALYKGREICIKSGTTGREYLPVVI